MHLTISCYERNDKTLSQNIISDSRTPLVGYCSFKDFKYSFKFYSLNLCLKVKKRFDHKNTWILIEKAAEQIF